MSQKSDKTQSAKRYWGWGLAVIGGAVAFWNWRELQPLAIGFMQSRSQTHMKAQTTADSLVELVPNDAATLRLTKDNAAEVLDIKVAEVKPAPPPERLL